MEEPGFWDNPEVSTAIVQESRKLKTIIERYEALCTEREDMLTLIEIGEEENDADLVEEIQSSLKSFEEQFEKLRIETLLGGEYDKDNAILTLHAGAGGTESCDWAGMLCRMYQRWAEKQGFQVEMLDFLDGEEAGLKSVTLQINGINAYGYLKSEHGVHRLVRISPFNAAGKRQTPSCPAMSCRILKRIWMWRLRKMISALTHTVRVVPEASILTRLLLQSVLRIFRQGLLYSARMSVPSI